jgi:pSer/pThr/pTyr-binding forkhead associated (FHA) protein
MTVTPIDQQTRAHASTAALDPLHRPTGEHAPPAAALPASGRYLVVDDDGYQQLLELTQPITRIGRSFTATLQIEDPSISRRHAIVVQRRGSVRILDDRSLNGVIVNGRRVAEAELRDGDVIVLGTVVVVYREQPGSAGPAGAQAS